MQPQQDPNNYHPETNVSFAPTEAFKRKWANEAKTQEAKFNTPSWVKATADEETAANPLLNSHDSKVVIASEDEIKMLLVGCMLGGLIGFSMGYLIYK